MTGVVRRIHHFEDEPQYVDWIPTCLFNRYMLEHPEWFGDGAHCERRPKDRCVAFTLSELSPPVTIEYRSYVDRDEFRERFPKLCLVGDILLLDVYVRSSRGLRADGLMDAYEIARKKIGEDGSIYFMTAYPSILSEKLPAEAHMGKTFPKPTDANEIVDLLVKHFDLRP